MYKCRQCWPAKRMQIAACPCRPSLIMPKLGQPQKIDVMLSALRLASSCCGAADH